MEQFLHLIMPKPTFKCQGFDTSIIELSENQMRKVTELKNYDEIRKSSFRVRWQLCEIHIVTQWKDGCVYRTKSLGMISCSKEYAEFLKETHKVIISSVSTTVTKLIGN